jgi:sec-independent protein translocase protein TatA
MEGTSVVLRGAGIVFFLAVALKICNDFFRELALTAASEICYGGSDASDLAWVSAARGFLTTRLRQGGFMFGLGVQELLIILVIALVLFGPSKLPQIGSGLGKAIRDFKKGISGEEPESGAKDQGAKKEDGKELPH